MYIFKSLIARHISTCFNYVSKDETRSTLNYVYVETFGDNKNISGLNIVATDGHRLRLVELGSRIEPNGAFFTTAEQVKNWKNDTSVLTLDDMKSIHISERKTISKIKQVDKTYKDVERVEKLTHYPDYSRGIPVEFSRIIGLDCYGLDIMHNAGRAVEYCGNPKTQLVKMSVTSEGKKVFFNMSEKMSIQDTMIQPSRSAEFETHTHHYSEHNGGAFIPVHNGGMSTESDQGFNGAYLAQISKDIQNEMVTNTGDKKEKTVLYTSVEWKTNTKVSATVFELTKSDEYNIKWLLMPLRIFE